MKEKKPIKKCDDSASKNTTLFSHVLRNLMCIYDTKADQARQSGEFILPAQYRTVHVTIVDIPERRLIRLSVPVDYLRYPSDQSWNLLFGLLAAAHRIRPYWEADFRLLRLEAVVESSGDEDSVMKNLHHVIGEIQSLLDNPSLRAVTELAKIG